MYRQYLYPIQLLKEGWGSHSQSGLPRSGRGTGAPSSGIETSPYGLYSGAYGSYGADTASQSKKSKVKKVLSTIIPLLGIAGAGVGGYYGYKKYKEHKRKQRIKDNLITGGLIAAPIAAAIGSSIK